MSYSTTVYNSTVTRLVLFGLATTLFVGCTPTREVERDLKIVDVHTGWYDAGIVEGQKNKLVPSISLKLQNVSSSEISRVQVTAIFRRKGEQEAWGEHFVRAIGSDGLAPGKTGGNLVLRSTLGYTGTDPRLKMLQNREFVDARVEVFGKHGSRTWAKMGEYDIDRQLLTQ